MEARQETMEERFAVPMLIAALLVIPVVVVESTAVSPALRTVAAVLNWLIWLAFAAEALAVLWVAERRGHWLYTHPLTVVIVLFTAPFLPASLQALRVLRALRALRVWRLVPSVRQIFSVDGIRAAGILTILVVLGGGAVYGAIENGRNGMHLTLWDDVWWAASTVTTVGYGDIYPHSTGGRIVALIVMFAGIAFVALVTGAFAQRFLAPEVEEIAQAETEIERVVGREEVSVESDIPAELRAIAARLNEIERRLASGGGTGGASGTPG